MISASRRVPDRNSPITAAQSNLSTSIIRKEHQPIRVVSPAVSSFRQAHVFDEFCAAGPSVRFFKAVIGTEAEQTANQWQNLDFVVRAPISPIRCYTPMP
jgi:hypothetical protein